MSSLSSLYLNLGYDFILILFLAYDVIPPAPLLPSADHNTFGVSVITLVTEILRF